MFLGPHVSGHVFLGDLRETHQWRRNQFFPEKARASASGFGAWSPIWMIFSGSLAVDLDAEPHSILEALNLAHRWQVQYVPWWNLRNCGLWGCGVLVLFGMFGETISVEVGLEWCIASIILIRRYYFLKLCYRCFTSTFLDRFDLPACWIEKFLEENFFS